MGHPTMAIAAVLKRWDTFLSSSGVLLEADLDSLAWLGWPIRAANCRAKLYTSTFNCAAEMVASYKKFNLVWFLCFLMLGLVNFVCKFCVPCRFVVSL